MSASKIDIHKYLADMRREYRIKPLNRDNLDPNPFRQFDRWFNEATYVEAMDANAMSIATVSADGQPSVRTVLLKYYDETGFVFYTNLDSRKAGEIDANPKVALLFYWHEVHRQVKITGVARKISAADNLHSLALCFAAVASARRQEAVVPGTVRQLPGS